MTFLLAVASVAYMYLVILDREDYDAKIAAEVSLLAIFWGETFINLYLRAQHSEKTNRELIW